MIVRKSLRFHTLPSLEENVLSKKITIQLQSQKAKFQNMFQRLQELSKHFYTPKNKQDFKLFMVDQKIKLSNLQQAKQMQDKAINKLAQLQLLKTKKRHKNKKIYSLDFHDSLSEAYSKRKYTSIYKQFLRDFKTRTHNEQIKQIIPQMRYAKLPEGIKNEQILKQHPKIIDFIQQKMQQKTITLSNQLKAYKIGDAFRKRQLQREKTIRRSRQIQLLKSRRVDKKQQLSNSLVLTYLNKIFNVKNTIFKSEARQQLKRYTSLDKHIFDEKKSASRYTKQRYTPDNKKKTQSFQSINFSQ